MWSTTKLDRLWDKLSTTKCENVKLSTTHNFPCEKGKLLSCRQSTVVDNVTCDCFLSSVGLHHLGHGPEQEI